MSDLTFGWLLAFCALVFAATIWIFGMLMNKRIDRIRMHIKEMSSEVQEMTDRVIEDTKRLNDLMDLSRKKNEDLR